ncbi:DNA repair metallo-beta-lactamase family protein [Rhynchospora pubera]|uniref:5' exonuclease Apollo n=1 Tax=Rhynchospora pubera TaxID=906938 RepID=A0AAV8CGI2_9POAL|nr:DNA repair metallo-beta-lactamase family protein [Rhynchospora pubera]
MPRFSSPVGNGLIAVDRWTEPSQAYFLTHLHSDHTQGLSVHWSRGPLFCSPITARLLLCKFKGFDASLIRDLEVGSTHTLSLISPVTGGEVKVRVTPIDANHCPGSVMYLFQGELGCVLYTGDFRWELTSERANMSKSTLLDALNGEKVDILYLDNTYCNPCFSFPSRKDAAQQVVDIIEKHPDHEVIIGIDTLGKEHLLLHISESLKTKIWVWPERLEIMDLLGLDELFTTDTSQTRIRAVPRYSLTQNNLESLNTIFPTIAIMPTGLPWSQNSPEKGAYTVPYTAHSSFLELEEFMKVIRPSIIVGIVSSSYCLIDPKHHFGEMCGVDNCSTKGHNLFFKVMKGSHGFKVRKKEGKTKVLASVQRSGVNIVRKERRGVKIEECESDFEVPIGSDCSS